VQISSQTYSRGGFSISSIELGKSEVKDGISLMPGDQITGVRILLDHHTGAIRGQIMVEGGILPPNAKLLSTIFKMDNDNVNVSMPSKDIDSSGKFFYDGLTAGEYTVLVIPIASASTISGKDLSKRVMVYDGSVTDVTIVVRIISEQKREEERKEEKSNDQQPPTD
jgi:hypothetical protein